MRMLTLTKDVKEELLDKLIKRSPNNYSEFEERVNSIINEVKERKDDALFEFTQKFASLGNVLDISCKIIISYFDLHRL